MSSCIPRTHATVRWEAEEIRLCPMMVLRLSRFKQVTVKGFPGPVSATTAEIGLISSNPSLQAQYYGLNKQAVTVQAQQFLFSKRYNGISIFCGARSDGSIAAAHFFPRLPRLSEKLRAS